MKLLEETSRPILRYHGGKWILAQWIISHFPSHRVYNEPFGGAASVLLQKARSYAEIYNDLDGEIVNLLRVVRVNHRELRRLLLRTPFARQEYRDSFERTDDPLEQARRTVIRSFMGFGSNSLNRDIKSGFRANSHRSGTTPAHDWKNYPKAMRFFERRLGGVTIENKNAIEVILRQYSEHTLHYLDPPYVHSTRAMSVMHGHHGYAHEMTDDQHVELAGIVNSVAGMVVISGYHSELYDDLYAGWHRVERAALGDGACERTEVLWINDCAFTRLRGRSDQMPLFGASSP